MKFIEILLHKLWKYSIQCSIDSEARFFGTNELFDFYLLKIALKVEEFFYNRFHVVMIYNIRRK